VPGAAVDRSIDEALEPVQEAGSVPGLLVALQPSDRLRVQRRRVSSSAGAMTGPGVVLSSSDTAG
jgi:hypothetical protein